MNPSQEKALEFIFDKNNEFVEPAIVQDLYDKHPEVVKALAQWMVDYSKTIANNLNS